MRLGSKSLDGVSVSVSSPLASLPSFTSEFAKRWVLANVRALGRVALGCDAVSAFLRNAGKCFNDVEGFIPAILTLSFHRPVPFGNALSAFGELTLRGKYT